MTQCAAVMTSRGDTTTAPQVWPASVSLTEASISAAAKGQAPEAACCPPITAPAGGGKTRQTKTTQEMLA